MRLETNPYRWNRVDPDMFFGRLDLLESMYGGLRRGDSFALIGGRRIGKTMLLRKLEQILMRESDSRTGVHIIPIYVSGQQFQPPLARDSIYLGILEELERKLAFLEISGPAASLVRTFKQYHQEENRGFARAVGDLAAIVSGHLQIVVLFDEIERLLASEWGPGFCDNWRQLLHNEPNISTHLSAVMAGAKEMSRIAIDVGSPLSNVLIWKQLGVFSKEETRQLVDVPTRSALRASVAEVIYEETGGHPFLIQYLMSIIAEGDLDDGEAKLSAAVARFFSEQSLHFASLWARLDEIERRAYSILAGSTSTVSRDMVVKIFGPAAASVALETLCHSGVARRQGESSYEVAGGMFRSWFLRNAVMPPTVSGSSSSSGSGDVEQRSREESRTVFVVHGRDDAARESVARFLEKLELRPIILHEQANRGLTIVEKFEAHVDVPFAVVLLMGDDVGALASEYAADKRALRKRARQNVILELGYFVAKLGRGRVCILHSEDLELPSDIQGVAYVPYDQRGNWRLELTRELRAADIEVDLNKAIGSF